MIFWESDLNFVTVLQTLTRRDQPWTFAVAKTKWSRGPACARRYDHYQKSSQKAEICKQATQ